MAEALYGPEGYYASRPRLGGADADFFTSPELHPAFGALLGELASRVWAALGRPERFDLVEHGPGTGALCRDLLDWADHVVPSFGAAIRYRLVEASASLRELQRETLTTAGVLDGRVRWEEAEGAGLFSGLILANELVDALPVHIVVMRDGHLRERYVVLEGEGLGWQEDSPSTPELSAYFERLGVWPAEGNIAEVNLDGVAWMERTAAMLGRGAMLVLDYGYPAPELYAAERRHGTLLTYRAHMLGSDPLRDVGGQDVTAHVDFTSLARAGERGGLETVGLISQAALLRRLGLDGYLRRLEGAQVSALDHDANRRALLTLIDPDGLGESRACSRRAGWRRSIRLMGRASRRTGGPARGCRSFGRGRCACRGRSKQRGLSIWRRSGRSSSGPMTGSPHAGGPAGYAPRSRIVDLVIMAGTDASARGARLCVCGALSVNRSGFAGRTVWFRSSRYRSVSVRSVCWPTWRW
jgi:SAM-dependent MidA family methyltransferase